MRILVFPGGPFANLGDVAMLQTALTRLKCLWPAARLEVLTNEPLQLAEYFPGCAPVPLRGAKRWLRVRTLPKFLFPDISARARGAFPLTPGNFLRLGGWLYPPDLSRAREFADALFGADLLVLTGCGLINDEFAFAAMRVLDIFDGAIRGRVPTVMLGQGFGPMQNPALARRAREVLPRVGLLLLRERLAGPGLLKQLGVPEEKIIVTGDDAVEMSFHERQPAPGHAIGVNLRLEKYSGLDDKTLETVRSVVVKKKKPWQSKTMGIPILMNGPNSDTQTIERLLEDPTTEIKYPRGPAALAEVIRRVGQCRVVVTGSYHAGVFALAQGIPAVTIARTKYYRSKFDGLADQFRAGCWVLAADDNCFAEKLDAAMDQAWNEAGVLRPRLLQAADAQVRAAREAYDRLPGLPGI
jgi:polysaccharide pyruvyl transferase WcaK-like protein